jgi:hypothetical protein
MTHDQSKNWGQSAFFRLALVPLALALPVSAPARAQDFAQPRTATCETWNAAKLPSDQPASPARASQLSLVFDYITAHDQEPPRDYYGGGINLTDGVEPGEIESWMDGYCAAYPRDNLEQAAAALVSDLSARWISSHSRQTGR